MKLTYKLLLTFILMFTVTFTNHTFIQAQDEQPVTTITETASIVPYARVCSCGNGTYYLSSTKAGSWATKKEAPCIHNNGGRDFIQTRLVTKTYRCNSCGKGYNTTSTETRRICIEQI